MSYDLTVVGIAAYDLRSSIVVGSVGQATVLMLVHDLRGTAGIGGNVIAIGTSVSDEALKPDQTTTRKAPHHVRRNGWARLR